MDTKEFLIDIIEHSAFVTPEITHIKIQIYGNCAFIECTANDKSLVIKAVSVKVPKLLQRHGTFGIKHINELYNFLTGSDYYISDIIDNTIVFTNNTTGKTLDYVLLSCKMIRVRLSHTDNISKDVRFVVTSDLINKIRKQAKIFNEELDDLIKINYVDNNLIFYFGDKVVGAADGEIQLTVPAKNTVNVAKWWWSVKLLLSLFSLHNPTVIISNYGAIVVEVKTKFIEYTYLVPAMGK